MFMSIIKFVLPTLFALFMSFTVFTLIKAVLSVHSQAAAAGKLGEQDATSLVKAWPGAAPAQCPLPSLSATSQQVHHRHSTSVLKREASLSPGGPCEKEVNCCSGIDETPREQIDTSRPSDSSRTRRVHQIKKSDRKFSDSFSPLWLLLDELHCMKR